MLGCCIPRDPSKHTNKLINEALERDRKALNAESKLRLLGKREPIPYFSKQRERERKESRNDCFS